MVVWRRVILPVLFLVVLGAAALALMKIAFLPDTASAEPIGPSAGVTEPVTAVARGSLVNELDLEGSIARDEEYVVRSATDGVVTGVHVADGDTVQQGQLLVTIKQNDPVRSIQLVAPEAGGVSDPPPFHGPGAALGGWGHPPPPPRPHLPPPGPLAPPPARRAGGPAPLDPRAAGP